MSFSSDPFSSVGFVFTLDDNNDVDKIGVECSGCGAELEPHKPNEPMSVFMEQWFSHLVNSHRRKFRCQYQLDTQAGRFRCILDGHMVDSAHQFSFTVNSVPGDIR